MLWWFAASAWAEAPAPRPLIGVTASMGHTLVAGKPSPYAMGVQTVVPSGPWRFAAEAFMASPTTAFTPALGGDVGVGLVNAQGVGAAIAAYGRAVLPSEAAGVSGQVGPGVMMIAKIAPTVLVTTPLVLWTDTGTGSMSPSLAIKLVLGVPLAP
jgi:hypothetical protein